MSDNRRTGWGSTSLHGLDVWFRPGTVDEQVLDPTYGADRFLPSGYRLPAAATAVDAGAHIGVLSLLLASADPAARVFAVEPEAENFALLTRNVEANGLTNVFPLRLALSCEPGPLRLYHGSASWGHSLHTEPVPKDTTYELVPAATLGDLLRDNAIDHVDYLKMNIEGAEYGLLGNEEADTLRRIRVMHVELHPKDDEVAHQLIARLREIGFSVTVDWTDHPHVKGWLTATLAGDRS